MSAIKYRRHYKETLLLAYPVCISQLGHILVGAVDVAFVGRISTEAQAAVSLAMSLFTLILVFVIGLSYGITPLIAIAGSRKDPRDIGSLLKHGFLINMVSAFFLFLLFAVSSPLLNHLNQPPDVVAMAIPFFNVMVFSLVPLAVFSTFRQFAEGLSDTRAAMIISLGGNLINIALNYLLIFGKLGFPAMGIMGSCWATFIARTLMAMGMFLYVRYHTRYSGYRSAMKNIFSGYSFPPVKRILNIGLPSGLQFIFEVGAFSFAAIMIGWLGANELASHQIALSVAAITYMVASGIGSAATVRVSNEVGAGNKAEMRRAGLSALFLVLGYELICAVSFILLAGYLPALFTADEKVFRLSAHLLILAAFFQISDGLQVVALGILRGMKDVKIPTISTLISYWIVGLPVCYLLAFPAKLGVSGIWYGFTIMLTCIAVILLVRFLRLSKTRNPGEKEPALQCREQDGVISSA